MLMVGLLLGIVIGFFLGTRARQLTASLKHLGQAMRSFTIKIPKPEEGDKGDDDGDEVDKEDDHNTDDILDYLSFTASGLDDHPDVVLNPILMFQIGKAKQQAREKKRLEMLANEGLTEEEIADALLQGHAAKGDGTQFRQNALACLINAGARVLPVSSSGSAETAAANDRRRLQRSIDTYLKKDLEIDTSKVAANARAPQGGRSKTPFDVANETALVPYGGESMRRVNNNPRVAQQARNIFREWKALQKARGIEEIEVEDSDGEIEKNDESTQQHGRRGAAIDMDDLALLRMEFEEEEGGAEEDAEDRLAA